MSELPKKSDAWCVIADYIINQENEFKRNHIDSSDEISFTRWGLELAKAIGISKYTFWQYRRSALLYDKVKNLLPLEKPIPLRELTSVAPENLNELQKISRVAPAEMLKDLCDRVIIKRNINRKELRAIWASLRPAMDGETGRGRTPNKSMNLKISEENTYAQYMLIEGLILLAIKNSLTTLFGEKGKPFLIDCRNQICSDENKTIDALVICTEVNDKKQPFEEINAISLGWPRGDRFLSELNIETPTFPCDRLWLVFRRDNTAQQMSYENIPDYLGIIEATIDTEKIAVSKLKVERPATPKRILHQHQITISILAKNYRNKLFPSIN